MFTFIGEAREDEREEEQATKQDEREEEQATKEDEREDEQATSEIEEEQATSEREGEESEGRERERHSDSGGVDPSPRVEEESEVGGAHWENFVPGPAKPVSGPGYNCNKIL